jgi:hypothetical protein
MLSDSGHKSLFPLVELAKYYEHKEKNASKALELVERACFIGRQLGLAGGVRLDELKRRYDRLKRKAGRDKNGGC